MLLVADAGNTNITMGIFNGDKLLSCFRMTTKMQRTSDEYGVFILSILNAKGVNVDDIEDVIKELGLDGYICGCGTNIYYHGKEIYHAKLPSELKKGIVNKKVKKSAIA